MRLFKALLFVLFLAVASSACNGGSTDGEDCDISTDCPSGMVCFGTVCVDGVPCEVDTDCETEGFVCENGACVRPVTLEENIQFEDEEEF